jgi:tetratricopeptide (TPR) repeat protein
MMHSKTNGERRIDQHVSGVLLGAAGVVLTVLAAGCGGGGRSVSTDPWSEAAAVEGGSWIEKVRTAETNAVLSPGEPFWPHTLGMLYAAVDSMGRAEGYWVKTLAVDPSYAPALTRLTQAYYADGHHADAVLRLETARALYAHRGGPFPAELAAGLALHYEAMGETPKVEALQTELLARNAVPASVAAYLLLRSADFMEAREPAERAMLEHPGSAVHFNNFGITRLQAGDPVEARKAFREAHELDPTLPGPLYNLALLEKYYFLNDEAARTWFARYWDLSHEDPDDIHAEFTDETPDEAAPGDGADTAGTDPE